MARGEIARWEYEPKTFEFVGIRRGTRFYTPDFQVFANDGTYAWHEVKGYMDARSATKLARFRRRFPAEPFVLIDKPAYQAIAFSARTLIANWEIWNRKL